jgi:hypothetical protein
MITVKIVKQSTGKPSRGASVRLAFDTMGRGLTGKVDTDQEGEAHFNADPGSGEVLVDGHTKHRGHLSGRVVVYI